jgi:dienelactone hydrolase
MSRLSSLSPLRRVPRMSRWRRPLFSCCRWAALVLALLLVSGGAHAEFRFEPAYPATPLKGPKAAKGAVVWSHGINFLYGSEASGSPTPVFVTLFRDQGWDVFRLNRSRMSEVPGASTQALVATAARLKREGYARVVLAGQSGGAWLSLMAAGESDQIDAVIANAPAYYGTDHPNYLKNGFILYDHLDRIRRGRIMITFFKDDPYDPGGRGAKSNEILAAHRVPHLIIDRPAGFSGHLGGDTGLFMRRFGPCVLAVADDGPMPTRAGCESDWGRRPSAELKLPPDLAIAAPTGDAAIDRFLGKWYGHYDTGQELMLVVEHVAGDAVEAVYAVGPTPDRSVAAFITHRNGRIVPGSLTFAEPGRPTLRCTARADGMLDAQWTAADGRFRLETTLRRLP